MKKFIYIVCMIILCNLLTVSVYAENKANSVNIIGESAIVREVETGDILYEKNIDVERYPASITKIMTALVVLENRELDDEVTFTEEALSSIESGSSAAYIKPGETLSVEQSLYIMMLHSANDVAHGLAYEVGGDLNGFANLMNKKATELGCTKTHFVNASGLTEENHYTTANDMSKIAREAYNNKILLRIMETKKYELSETNKCNEARSWTNGNRMIREGSEYFYEPCLGGKTGYTVAAGGTLVTYAKIKNTVLECVILKSENSATAYEDSIKLYKYLEKNQDFSAYTQKQEESTVQDTTSEIEKEPENIIYDTTKTPLEKVISIVKIAFFVLMILCIGVILRIIYVQRQRRKRRKAMKKRRQQKNRTRKR